jgi:polyhydroxyalkanoate synthesis regulator phasin
MARREELRSMQDAWRAYLDVALGVTETSRKRALKVAKKLVGRGGATAEQLQSMAEDLVSTSLANREALVRLVRFELDRALGRVGLATAEEVAQLTARVRELEEELREERAVAPAVTSTLDDELAASPASATVSAAPAPATVVRKAVAKKAPAPAAKAAPATQAAPAAKAAPVTKAAPGKAAPAKAAKVAPSGPAAEAAPVAVPAKKVVAKAPVKAVAKKTVARKATGPAGGLS